MTHETGEVTCEKGGMGQEAWDRRWETVDGRQEV